LTLAARIADSNSTKRSQLFIRTHNEAFAVALESFLIAG
jgi:hypothetical protein